MSGAHDLPVDAPRSLLEELHRRDARLIRRATEARRAYLWLESDAGALFARYSTNPFDRAVFEHEVRTREVVGRREQLRAPAVLTRGDSWLLEEAIDGRPVAGKGDLELAIRAAGVISELALPPAPPGSPEGVSARIARRVRLLRFPGLVPELRRARRILRAIDLPTVTSHGDFHPGNMMIHDSSLYVFDWEMVGQRPAGYDLLQLWCSLPRAEDRAVMFEGALELAGSEHRAALARLRYALAVETAAIKMSTALPVSRDLAGARRLISLLSELRRPRSRADD